MDNEQETKTKKESKPKHRMYCGKSGMSCCVYHGDGICPDVRDCEACKEGLPSDNKLFFNNLR